MPQATMAYDLDDEVGTCNCSHVRRAARMLSRFYDAKLAETGLRATQFTILVHVQRRGEITIGDLADLIVADKATMSHNLKPLERSGLVRMKAGANDRRVKVVTITPSGRKALAACEAGWRRAQREFEKAFGAREAKALRAMLARVVETGIGAGE